MWYARPAESASFSRDFMKEVRCGACAARLPSGGKPALAATSSAKPRQITSTAATINRIARFISQEWALRRAPASARARAHDERRHVVTLRRAAAEALDRAH